ncbi:MAG: flavodoxin family protein [Chloroflexi bacterium]|nr:flavodoxin family protein [Chloroflexota bacterium]
MKVIGISGSPIAEGNTDTAVRAVLDGARANGAEVEFVRLYDLELAPCDACDACTAGGGCVIPDDATDLMARMKDADAFVFGTPVYWYHVSGVFKNFADRTYASYHHKDFAGKRVAALMVQHSLGAEEAVALFNHWCEDEQCTLVEAVTINTASRPDATAGDAGLLARLRRLGERL